MRQRPEQQQVHERDHGAFAPGAGDLARPGGKQRGVRRPRVGHHRGERVGRVDGVGVGKKEVLAPGGGGELVTGPRFAGPALRERGAGEDLEGLRAGKRAGQAGGVIFRMIVEQDELEAGIILREQGAQAIDDATAFVARRDEDGDQRRVGQRPGAGSNEEPPVEDDIERDREEEPANGQVVGEEKSHEEG